jgi:Putative amidoligase enzyme
MALLLIMSSTAHKSISSLSHKVDQSSHISTTRMSPWQYIYSPLDDGNGKLDCKPGEFPKLSFGVELEFSLAALPFDVKDREAPDGREVYGIIEEEGGPNQPTVQLTLPLLLKKKGDRNHATQRHISNTLMKKGIRAIGEMDRVHELADMPLDRWIVTEDTTIKHPPLEGLRTVYEFQEVEMQSPAYLMTEGSLREVQRVCHLITCTYRTYSGSSTGLHVHVGNSTRAFTLETVQNVVAILFAFEPQLDTLHPEHRRKNGYCLPLRSNSRLALRMLEEKIDLRDILDEIYKTTSINQLIKLMSASDGSGYKMGVNLGNLLEPYVDERCSFHRPDNDLKKTIEFRQHEGTLDPEAVYNWAKVCVNIVEFAQEVPTPKLQAWLRWNINQKVEEYPAVAVLYALKIPRCALYYEKKLAERSNVSSGS